MPILVIGGHKGFVAMRVALGPLLASLAGLSAPAAGCAQDTGGAGARRAPSSATATQTGPLLFASDFSAGDAQDNRRWPIVGRSDALRVVPSTGLDFPTARVLQVNAVARYEGYAFLRKTGLPVPEVGESRYYRWYFRAMWPDNLRDPESHPVQDGNASSDSNWLFHAYHNEGGPGKWRPQLRVRTAQNPFPNDRWFGPVLDKQVTYRFEVQIHRNGRNTFQLHTRIYDAAGTLLHDDADFVNQDQRRPVTLAAAPTFTFYDIAKLDGLNAGCNGIMPPAPFPFIYAYQGGFAVAARDWIGPYRAGER